MADDLKTADWAPGTLDNTRRNIGEIDREEAKLMAKKLGGEVMYERSSSTADSLSKKSSGKIIRPASSGSSAGAGSYSGGGSASQSNKPKGVATAPEPKKKRTSDNLPSISKKTAAAFDKLMMSPDYKIKPNYGFFNFMRSLQKNGTEKLSPEFVTYTVKAMIDHMEAFITVIKTLIQMAPATYKSKIAADTEPKFKLLRMVAGWTMQNIRVEYVNMQSFPQPWVVADMLPIVRAIYRNLITLYYYGNNKIPKLIKEIYTDETAYPEAPRDKLSKMAKEAITEWLYIDTEIIKKLYPLLMRMCCDTVEPYPSFFNSKVAEILKFLDLHKYDLLLPEKPKPVEEKKEAPKKPAPPERGLKDQTVLTGLKLLEQLFPESGLNKLESHEDLYPYFQPLFKYEDGFNSLSPNNSIQAIIVLQTIIEYCFQGCRNINFTIEDEHKKDDVDTIYKVLDDWSAYREDVFGRLYCEPLLDLTNSIYSQPDFDKSHIGKRTITNLLWQTTYHFLPMFKFEKLILEHPADESKYKPLFHRTDFVRKFLTQVVNQCDQAAKTRSKISTVENPWQHYKFDVQNEVSKRLDVLLGAQNHGPNTNATNANLLKYTLCFVAVLDWYINNPESPAYSTDPMDIYRISNTDGKPQFTVETRSDQNKLFAAAVKASYQKGAK